MSKIFSFVKIETNTGVIDTSYVPGIPDLDDIQKSIFYKKILEKYNDIEFIDVILDAYCYGGSQGVESTNSKDLEYIRSIEDITLMEEVNWLLNYKFTIYPQQI